MTELAILRNANIARQAEWPGGEHVDLAFRGLELAGEMGEFEDAVVDLIAAAATVGRLSNLLKKAVRLQRGIAGTVEEKSALMQAVEDEAADVVICVDLVCMELGIDLSMAVANKFNKTSRKHGLRTRLLA